MRRTHLRGHANILKRLLIHVVAFNLSLIFRSLLGAGTPRELRNPLVSFFQHLFCLLGRSSGKEGLFQRPSARNTAGIVLNSIFRSNPKLQFSMYSRSRAMLVSNDGSVRAVTCQSPVNPGLTSSRRRCSME